MTYGETIESRRFRRKVEPFDDIEVDVDLQSVLEEGPGHSPAHYDDVWLLADWIEDGWVSLRVVSLHHVVPTGHHEFLYEELKGYLSGGEPHQRLCALACCYLHTIGKEFLCGGASACSYSGGWADVIATDRSLHIECGTLNTKKPFRAMCAGETLMVIPYGIGCDTPPAETVTRLDPHPERVGNDIQLARKFDVKGFEEMKRLGRIELGFIFEPKCKLRPNPFAEPTGLRPSRRTNP